MSSEGKTGTAGRTLTLGEIEVPRIGLGTNRLSHTPEHVAFVQEAVAAGIRVIDTAHTYAGGESETTIGEALSPLPADVVVATKGGWNDGRPEAIRAQIDESLRRLRTDSIALYYLHRPDPKVPIEESLGAIREERDSGKIRSVGISQVDVEQIERARQVVPIAAVQNHYSLSERAHESVLDYCAREGIAFVPFFPLRGVSGPTLGELAERRGVTAEQIALAWLLGQAPVTLPIPGTLSTEHLHENLAALELELSEAELHALG
jgi:aryl-alcohol dehydrogenase-like predicted oxidoreductase